jgi:NADH-quinone oxidoreductase subunit M
MVNHGVSTGGLFLCVGMLYERSHTRRFDELGGIGNTMPVYAGLFLIITLSSVGLPGLNGFVGEFLALAGAFAGSNPWFAVVGTSGVILAAVYLLWMYQRVVYGTEPGDLRQPWPDLNLRELVTLVPIVVMTVWIGLFPSSFLGVVEGSAEKLIKGVNAAQTEALDTDARLAESRMEPRR